MPETPRLIFDGELENGWQGSVYTDYRDRRVFTLKKNDLMIRGHRDRHRHTRGRVWRSDNWLQDFTSQREIVDFIGSH